MNPNQYTVLKRLLWIEHRFDHFFKEAQYCPPYKTVEHAYLDENNATMIQGSFEQDNKDGWVRLKQPRTLLRNEVYWMANGAVEGWSNERVLAAVNELEEIGLIERKDKEHFRLKEIKMELTIQRPPKEPRLTKKEYDWLMSLPVEERPPVLLRENGTPLRLWGLKTTGLEPPERAEYETPNWLEMTNFKNRLVGFGLCSLRNSEFGKAPDTYAITADQREHLETLKPIEIEPRTKYETDEERLEARKRQLREASQKYRDKKRHH